MADQTPLEAEAANPVRFAIRAAKLTAERTYTGLVLDNVELDVQGKTAEEVERLLAAFWSHIEGRQPSQRDLAVAEPVTTYPEANDRNKIASNIDLSEIRHRMVDMRINQAELADKIGVNPSRVSLFLRGRTKLASDTRSKLLAVLGLRSETDP